MKDVIPLDTSTATMATKEMVFWHVSTPLSDGFLWQPLPEILSSTMVHVSSRRRVWRFIRTIPTSLVVT